MNELENYRDVLGAEMRRAWPHIAAAAPKDSVLLGGTGLTIRLRHRTSVDLDLFTTRSFDPDQIEQRLLNMGNFAVEIKEEGTLNGTFDTVRVQILWGRGQRPLAPPTLVAGLPVGSLEDIAATKLNAIAGRAQLRDYFDLMCIEQRAGLRMEEGMRLFMERFGVDRAHGAVSAILRGLGFFDDVPDDPGLVEAFGRGVRTQVIEYWTKRQGQIISTMF